MAAQFVKEFYQDLHSPIYLRHGGQILFGGDSKSTILTIHLTDNGEEYTGGGVVTGTAIRTKDGGTVPLTGSISGGTVTVTLIANCFYQPGAPINVFVKLSSSDIETTILGVVYDVIATSTSNTIDPSGEITINVNTLITEINEAIATIPPEYDDMMGSIAPAYTDLTFPIDAYKQLCWYDGLLYINNVDITTGENWTPAHWTATDVSGEFADLCDNLILVQTTQPAAKYNKIWVDADTPDGIQVPTYSEFNELAKNIKDGTGTGAIIEGLTEAIGATPANVASGQYAHAEGYITTASGSYAHAEGIQTTATNNNTHAEGQGSEASGRTSHAEGYNTKATGEDSHAEGDATQATGRSAHAEGVQTRAIGNYSHAQGSYTRATHKAQHVFGEYNVDDGSSATASARGNYVEIVGNGTSSSNKSNARTLDWSGNETLKGDLTIKKGVTGEKSMSALVTEVEALQTSVGNTPMGTEATTITGAIKEHGDDLEDLQSAIVQIDDNLFAPSEMSPNATATGWRLNESNGLCSSNSDYQLNKYIVKAGDEVKVISDDRFQFQNASSVPSSGSNKRVGDTYQDGTFLLTVPDGATYLIVSTLVTGSTATVYHLINNTEKNADDIDLISNEIEVADIVESVNVSYQDGSHGYATSYRSFWPDVVPEGSYIDSVYIPTGSIGSTPSITVEVWEIGNDNDTLTKVFNKTVTPLANTTEVIKIDYHTKANALIARRYSNVQLFYRSGQTGSSYYTSSDTDAQITLLISSLTKYTDFSLVGGFEYVCKKTVNTDFFSGYLTGNIIVFGDSTVDGSSTTDHTDNVIGTDRTAVSEPNVYTSIMEGMIRTFNGNSNFRVYNGGFGGKTLNYIADNYTAIMAAFSNVKSALLVIDANSANNPRSAYASRLRLGLERMIKLLRADGIAVAIASPQPMFYYPADDNGLPAINSAGEFAIAVNVGKDVCEKYGIPFINLGGITNKVMESPYFKATTFYGDRLHFGDGGHRFEAYELYGELIHPIIYFDGKKTYIPLESNKCELSASSGISANTVDGYRSIVLQSTHTRTDVLARFYIIAEVPFKLGGISAGGWAYNSDMYVDGSLYTEGVPTMGDLIQPGTHEVTIKPEAGKLVRFSGLMIESAE